VHLTPLLAKLPCVFASTYRCCCDLLSGNAGGMGQGISFDLLFSLVSDGRSAAGLFRGMSTRRHSLRRPHARERLSSPRLRQIHADQHLQHRNAAAAIKPQLNGAWQISFPPPRTLCSAKSWQRAAPCAQRCSSSSPSSSLRSAPQTPSAQPQEARCCILLWSKQSVNRSPASRLSPCPALLFFRCFSRPHWR